MTTISVIYPRSAGATFDYQYYEEAHLPLVVTRWQEVGLVGANALRGISALDGTEADFFAIALIQFETIDQLRAAVAGAQAAEIISDIANFTNVQPMIQVNERIGG